MVLVEVSCLSDILTSLFCIHPPHIIRTSSDRSLTVCLSIDSSIVRYTSRMVDRHSVSLVVEQLNDPIYLIIVYPVNAPSMHDEEWGGGMRNWRCTRERRLTGSVLNYGGTDSSRWPSVSCRSRARHECLRPTRIVVQDSRRGQWVVHFQGVMSWKLLLP